MAQKRDNSEEKFQRAVVNYFNYAMPELVFFHPRNQAAANAIEGAKFKAMGVIPGVPDLILLYNGKVGALELKSAKGYLSNNQRIFRDRWVASGGLYALCRTFDEVEAFIKLLGIEPRYKPPVANERSERQMLQQLVASEMFRPVE